jgi:hypothetical protein
METYPNRKREVPVVPIVIIKFIELIASTKAQFVKSRKIHVRYPCINCSTIEHRYEECPRKIEIQNMFRTTPFSSNAMITFKLPTIDNVSINVVDVVTTHNQQLEQ